MDGGGWHSIAPIPGFWFSALATSTAARSSTRCTSRRSPRRSSSACGEFIEPKFTGKLLVALRSRDAEARRACEVLADILVTVRISGASVERAHLPGEACKPAPGRVWAKEFSTTAGHTYRRFVGDEHRGVQPRVQEIVLQGAGLSNRLFSAMQWGRSFGSCREPERAPAGMARSRALAGIDIFRAQQCRVSARIGPPEHIAAMARIAAEWRDLTRAEKVIYQQKSEAMNASRGEARRAGEVDQLGLGRSGRRQFMQEVVQNAHRQIEEHLAWIESLGI